MTMTLPTPVNLHTTDPDTDGFNRGSSGSGTAGVKGNGNLPLSSGGSQMNNNTASNPTGVPYVEHWEFLSSGGYDMSDDHRLMVWHFQYNAPNRVQCATNANDGHFILISSSTASPPTTDWMKYDIGGNDRVGGSAREEPKVICIDLDSTGDSESGTRDRTSIQTYANGTVRFDLSGGNSQLMFFTRIFAFSTLKDNADCPTFSGASDWEDLTELVQGADFSDIIGKWATDNGNSIFEINSPINIGNNSSLTNFDDNGATVFWPNNTSSSDPDPRFRLTDQAFRVYLNLRNDSADTAIFSGSYDAGNSNPPWDFDQDDAAIVTFTSPTFKNTGDFAIGSSITGPGNWDGCGVVDLIDNSIDIDGSTFKNPNGDHLLSLAA